MKELLLTRGYIATVDDTDYERAIALPWYLHVSKRHGLVKLYARHRSQSLSVYLHRFLLEVNDPKIEVDHKDGNGLNCQRQNLRVATSSQNKHNARLSRRSASGFKGVNWVPRLNKWRASICLDYDSRHLGLFVDKIAAAKAYDQAAREMHGKFAATNESLGLLPKGLD